MTTYSDPANPHRIYKQPEPAEKPKLKKKPIGCTTSIDYRQRLQLTFFPLSFVEIADLDRFTQLVWAFMADRGVIELKALTEWAEIEIPRTLSQRADRTKITYDLFKGIFDAWEDSTGKRDYDRKSSLLTKPTWLDMETVQDSP